MTDYGEVHRKHMIREIERQDAEWKALNKRQPEEWSDWIVFGLWSLAAILMGVAGVFMFDGLEKWFR